MLTGSMCISSLGYHYLPLLPGQNKAHRGTSGRKLAYHSLLQNHSMYVTWLKSDQVIISVKCCNLDQNICQDDTRTLGIKEFCWVAAYVLVPEGQIIRSETKETCQIFFLHSTIFIHISSSLTLWNETIFHLSVIIFLQ
jgi:hypothetical protein